MLNRLKSIWSALDQARGNTVRDGTTLAHAQDDVNGIDADLRCLIQTGDDMATLLKRHPGYGPAIEQWKNAVGRVRG